MNRLVATFIMLTMTGFCSASEENGPQLEATDWRLSSYLGLSGGMQSVPAGVNVSARLVSGKVTGKAGCNRFNATYGIDENRIAIEQVVTTRMYCGEPEGIMDLERQYLAGLVQAHTFTIRSDRLELRDEAGVLQLSFTR